MDWRSKSYVLDTELLLNFLFEYDCVSLVNDLEFVLNDESFHIVINFSVLKGLEDVAVAETGYRFC